jgi:hypothetical protein
VGWNVRVAINDGRVGVASVGAMLVVDDVYRRSSIG